MTHVLDSKANPYYACGERLHAIYSYICCYVVLHARNIVCAHLQNIKTIYTTYNNTTWKYTINMLRISEVWSDFYPLHCCCCCTKARKVVNTSSSGWFMRSQICKSVFAPPPRRRRPWAVGVCMKIVEKMRSRIVFEHAFWTKATHNFEMICVRNKSICEYFAKIWEFISLCSIRICQVWNSHAPQRCTGSGCGS